MHKVAGLVPVVVCICACLFLWAECGPKNDGDARTVKDPSAQLCRAPRLLPRQARW